MTSSPRLTRGVSSALPGLKCRHISNTRVKTSPTAQNCVSSATSGEVKALLLGPLLMSSSVKRACSCGGPTLLWQTPARVSIYTQPGESLNASNDLITSPCISSTHRWADWSIQRPVVIHGQFGPISVKIALKAGLVTAAQNFDWFLPLSIVLCKGWHTAFTCKPTSSAAGESKSLQPSRWWMKRRQRLAQRSSALPGCYLKGYTSICAAMWTNCLCAVTDVNKETFCSAVVIKARGLCRRLIYSHSYVNSSVIRHSHCLRYVLHETGLCKVMTTKQCFGTLWRSFKYP